MREHKAFKTILLSVFLVVIGFVSGVLFIKYTAPTQDKAEASNEEQSSDDKEPEKITDEYKHYIIDQNLAEDTCTDEKLIYSKVSKSKYSMRTPYSVGYSYDITDWYDKNGNHIASIHWDGYNNETDSEVGFDCYVSSDKEGNVIIHYLGVDGITISGVEGFKKYRDDGKESFIYRYSR